METDELTTYISKKDFLHALSVTEQDFDVPGLGSVRIRALTLAERGVMQKKYIKGEGVDNMGMQTELLLKGLVSPRLSEKDVAAIKAGLPGLVDMITLKIMGASGMGENFEKKVGPGS